MKDYKYKVIVAGGREFNNPQYLDYRMDQVLQDIEDRSEIQIVSGKAKGADFLGEKYAKENKLDIKEFPADWEKYGKMAGPKRNVEMAEYANMLVAFWDGESRGTANMIFNARNLGLQVHVFYYKPVIKHNTSLKVDYTFCEPLYF